MSLFYKNRFVASLAITALTVTSGLTPVLAMASDAYIKSTYSIQSSQSSINSLIRLGGYDRYSTAVKIADHGWKSASTAVLAPSGDLNMVDALTSSSLAKAVDGPILLADKDSVPSSTLTELQKLGVTKVYLVCGTTVISAQVESELTTFGIQSVRLGGNDRYETAVNIAKEIQKIKPFQEVVVTNAFANVDAISIAPIAAAKGIPILLVDKDSIPKIVSDFIKSSGIIKTYVIGGTAVVSNFVKDALPNAVRLGGKDRFDTNREVIKQFENLIVGGSIFFANGSDANLIDSLTGAPMAAKLGGAIVLSNKEAVPVGTKGFIQTDICLKNPVILGGTAVMSDSAVQNLGYAQPAQSAMLNGAVELNTPNAIFKDVTVNGNILVDVDGVTLKNVIVNGTVFVDPGKDGSTILDGVKATRIVVLSGADHSIQLKGTTSDSLVVSSPADVHVVAETGTTLGTTLVQCTATVESQSGANVGILSAQPRIDAPINVQLQGTFSNDVALSGSVKLTAADGAVLSNVKVTNAASPDAIQLSGQFASVSIVDSSPVTIVAGTVAKMSTATPSSIVVKQGAAVTSLSSSAGNATLSGGGTVNGNITTATPTSSTIPVSPTPTQTYSSGGSTSAVAVSAITVTGAGEVTTVVYGGTLQMSAAITPANASYQTIAWTVAPRTGTATINSTTGLLVATGVGTVTVTATNVTYGVNGSKDITINAGASNPVGTAPVNLGMAGDYAILAKTGISSVPASVITGNIGVSPAAATDITGFSLTADATNVFSTSPQVVGKAYAANYTSPTPSNLTTAISNMEAAYTDAAGRAVNYTELYTGDISGQTLTAGVYKWGTAVLINSDVTLQGGANDVWIFQIAKGITQASGTRIILTGGAQAKNIFWQAAETVAIGTGAHFEGIILGMTRITLGTNASINGRLLAQTAVTLDQSTVVAPLVKVNVSAINVTSGTAKVGVELTAGAITPAGATASYQWQICATAVGVFTDIAGATTNKYTPVASDATKFIKVVATGIGNYSGTVTSVATEAVAKADGPALTGVTMNDTANTVSGMTAAMECSTNGTDWTACIEGTAFLPDLTGTVALQVRVAATATHGAGAATTFNFTVPTQATLSSLAITTPATKLAYKVGETLDITGMVVTGTYSDASTKAETTTATNVTGFNSSAVAGSQTLTVTVGGKTVTYTIAVAKADGPALTGVTMNDTANTVSGLTAAMEFSTDGTTWTAYNAITPNLPALTGTVALQVRVAATATHGAGAATTFNFTSVGTAPVNLGMAGNYAILAKSGISSVPDSVITGNIGVSPFAGTAITGFSLTADATNVFSTSTQVTGKIYAANYTSPTPSNLTTAISNMEAAYTDAAGRAPNYTELYTGDLSGQTLTAGVYKWGTDVLINTDVTLNGGANDVWIFQVAGKITQANGTGIILTGGAQAKNIFWQAAGTVAIGTGAHFEGIILGMTNITLGTNASINGRLLAQTAVTLIKNTVVAPSVESVTVTPAAPAVTRDDTANTVTGMAIGMEYKIDGVGYVAYNATTFALLDFSGNHTLLVRVAAEGINPVGPDTTLIFTTN